MDKTLREDASLRWAAATSMVFCIVISMRDLSVGFDELKVTDGTYDDEILMGFELRRSST